ncbi:MAG: hypothetical protein ACR2KZ_19680 [Segetibacter sp.]
MAKPKQTDQTESDGTFFLKIVVYILAGTFWLKFMPPLNIAGFPLGGIPIGLFVGLLFARHEHFQIDRKLEYVVLIVMTIISFFLPAGIIV